jgi:hypothetical protein
MSVEINRNVQNFPNGSNVVSITTGTSDGGTPPNYSGVVTAITVTQGPGGVNPPGYPAAWPGATLVPTP